MVAQFTNQSAQLENKKHYYESIGHKKGSHMRSLKAVQKYMASQIQKLESEMTSLIRSNDPELLTCLLSIPGIGKKTAVFLIIMTNVFLYNFSTKIITNNFIIG